MPASGSPTKPSRGLSALIRPVALEPETVWWSRIRPSQSSKRSAKRSWIIGPYSTSWVGSPIGASSTALVKRSMNSSWIDSCTITVPSEVQRCPAVPKPLKSAPSTARSSSASGITTSGFLPPSSRQGDCTWRPQSAPISEPTADEPVKPTLSTSRSPSARSSPSKAVGPSHSTRLRTPSGSPPWMKSCASAAPIAGAYSAGFQTTALPHRIAGTMYHEGTATGKFPAVMIAATPTGLRKVKSCLSGISLGTVWPYSRRPSPTKKSQVSMISCTSPSDSG